MKKLIGLLSLLTLIFTSCATIEPVTLGGVETPRVKKLSMEGIDVDFGMRIKNPNKMSVNVYPSEFNAVINGIDIGKVKLTRKVKIRANEDQVPEFNIKADFSKLSPIDLAKIVALIGSKNATIELKGNVKVGKWYYKKKFPVELKKNVSLK